MEQVNIIMAAYNGEKYIGEQIESIVKNQYKDWILWIFDDGSTDKTSLVIKDFAKEYPDKIRCYKNKENAGVTKNFLKGLKVAAESTENLGNKQSYYMFCDQDDVWMPDKIEKTIKYMGKLEGKYGKEKALAVFTDTVIVNEKLELLYPSFYKRSNLDTKKLDLAHLMMENKLIGCTVMMNSCLVEKLQVIPKKARYHDWWMALLASSFGHIGFLPEPTLYYRQHSKNVVGNKSFFSYVKNRIKNLSKQRDVILQTCKQAEEFYQIYGNQLSYAQKMQVYAMAYLREEGWLRRRSLLFQYGFFKTGLLRNVGLLWII